MNKNRIIKLIPVFTVLAGFIVGGIIIAATGSNPFTAFWNLIQGCGLAPKASYAGKKGMITDLLSFIDLWTPMILASLSVAVAMRVGLFNIGVSGQMLFSGFIATVVVGYSGLDAFIAKPLVIVVGIVAGAFAGGIIGFLKFKFNINEVVSSIMLNYTFSYVISFFINTFLVDPVSRQSKAVSAASRLTLKDVELGAYKMDIPLGIVIAVIAVIVIWIFFNKTVSGMELKAVGLSNSAARYAGMSVNGNIMKAMMIAGALAGLAGVTYYLGYFGSIQPRVLPATGFDSIAVALLGNNQPIGIVFASFLITVLSKGSTYMNSASGVQAEIANVITGIILLFCACNAFIKWYIANRDTTTKKGFKRKSKKADKDGGAIAEADDKKGEV
ncbi:MAG: ABC transporter permease [Firmicutes bacterium]|nr:ABC transporter permease [Bacillota bacterium]